MDSVNVKIDFDTYVKLKQTAAEAGKPVIEVLAEAVDAYRRGIFLENLNVDFARLRSDASAWQDERAERRDWEGTLADGQKDE